MQDKKKANCSISVPKNVKAQEVSQKIRQNSQLNTQKKGLAEFQQLSGVQTDKSKVQVDQFQNFYEYLNASKDIISLDVGNQIRNLSGEKTHHQNYQNVSQINMKKKCITMSLLNNAQFDEDFVNELVSKNEISNNDVGKQKAPQTQIEPNMVNKCQTYIEKSKSTLNVSQNEDLNIKLNKNSQITKILKNEKRNVSQIDSKTQNINQEQTQNQYENQQQKIQKKSTFPIQADNSKNNFSSPKQFLHKQKQQKTNMKLEDDFKNLNAILNTPKKINNEDQIEDQELLLDQDSDLRNKSEEKCDSNDSDSKQEIQISDDESNEDDRNDDEQIFDDEKKIGKIQKQKEDEEKSLRDFALKNGFIIHDSSIKKKELNDIYEEAANFKITKEFLDEQEILDRERFFNQMYRPPALDILQKKYINKEPVRTGFNQGLLPIYIKNNYESSRMPQGPQIIVTTTNQKKKDSSERGSRLSQRQSHSRDSQISKFDNLQKTNQNLRQSSLGNNSASKDQLQNNSTHSYGADDENEQQKVQLVQQTNNNESSLRHLFYLEYKKNFQEGQVNPIVYSRFGKATYNSDEKFDTNNFNQLIRTCNLKKILKQQEQLEDKNDKSEKQKVKRKFQKPLSYPCQDYYALKDTNDKTLVFESRFESGNLQLAHKVSDNEYDLILQNDINSKGHTQWFYFRVNNVKKGHKVKFNMLNMIKSKSLYNEGMRVLIYSVKKQEQAEFLHSNSKNQSPRNFQENSGWVRGGEELGYFQNKYKKENQTNAQRCYFTFTFTHTFEYDNDYVYFAYSQPYTYTDLIDYLCEIESRQFNYVTRKTLCRTIAGNKCEYLSITNRTSYDVDKQKEGVVLTARIHPGESISSWIMKGIIDFLISSDLKANELRDKFVFKIVPMLNPDGVINGNYRCSLAGCDLNRRWKFPSEILHPTVYHTKNLILKLANERPLALYCDIHAHSRKKNIFIYGNANIENPEQPRAFPFLLSKVGQPHFSYDYSRFNYSRSKEQTARIAVWRELGCKIYNIFTLEASFCGPKPVKFEPHRGNRRAPTINDLNYHFNTKDFIDCGKNLCEALHMYRVEKDSSSLGLQNLEYQVEQYQIEKEQKMEQEELIRQQNLLIEHRKLLEIQNRQNKNNLTSQEQEKLDSIISTKEKLQDPIKKDHNFSILKNEKQINIQLSSKKIQKKSKTESINDSIFKSASKQDDLQNENEIIKGKKKVNYNIRVQSEESDALSDSEPSEDNLEEDQIMKLIPKKYGKKKYIFGIEEVIQKPKREKKTEKKQVKTELMPCLQSKRKEIDEKQKKEQTTAEKPVVKKQLNNSISKTIIQKRNGNVYRDVATQIMYLSDGTNLSLMEIDILNHTGCKWSPIIYPGYLGAIKFNELNEKLRVAQQNDKEVIVANFYKSTQVLLNQDIEEQLNFKNQNINRPSNIQCENLMVKNEVFQNNPIITNQNQEKQYNILNQKQQSSIINVQKSLQNITENFFQSNSSQANNSKTIQNILQQKIQETKFNEPKSLMSGFINQNICGSNMKQQYLRQNPFEYGSGKSQESFKQKNTMNYNNIVFDLNLETVHEKANDKIEVLEVNYDTRNLSLDINEKLKQSGHNTFINKKYSNSNNLGAQLKMKKIINGSLVPQSINNSQGSTKQITLNISNQKPTDYQKIFQKVSLNGEVQNSGCKNQQQINLSTGKNQLVSLSINSTGKNPQTFESKTSFSKVAQQILLNNSDTKKQHMNFSQHVYDDQVAQGTSSNFSFNQSAKIRQDNILKGQFEFLQNHYQSEYKGSSDIVEKTLNKIGLCPKNGLKGQHDISSISQLTGGISIQYQQLNNI